MNKDFGAYTLHEVRGGGGMGKLYRATQKTLGKTVAIKLLRTVDTNDESAVARFRREALLGAGLNHEHVVQVLDFGIHDGEYFIAEEYVDGLDLREWLGKYGPVPIEIAVLMMRDISRGIEHAHQHGLVHRDIKPGNIMFRRDGVIKITDFGLARQTGTSSIGVTLPGAVIGAPAYMSPEQANGEEVDQRSDIFSAGVVGYELFGGERPFPGETYSAVRHNILTLDPKSLADLSPLAPDEVIDVIDQMLKKDRAKRCRSMEIVRSVLDRVADQMGLLRGDKELLGEYARSPVEISQALRKKRLSYHMTQGIAYEKTGQEKYEDALREFLRVVHLDPANREAQRHIEKLREELDTQRTRPIETPKPPSKPSGPKLAEPRQAQPKQARPEQKIVRQLIAAAGAVATVMLVIITLLWWSNRPATLRITARPLKSLLYVDEAQLPALPTVERKLKKGEHRIRVEKEGYRAYEKVITLGPGETRPLIIKLDSLVAQAAALRVETVPPGARVFVDGQPRAGVTNLSIEGITAGTHTIRAELSGYEPAERRVTVEPGQTPPVSLTLMRQDGTLRVSSRPDGARILLDGRLYSRTTNTVLEHVKRGPHVIRLEKDGYVSEERTISVPAGGEIGVNPTLRKQPGNAATGGQAGDNVTPQAKPGKMATVRVQARPYADYFVDGEPRAKGMPSVELQLEAGRLHLIKIVHPSCGFYTWTIKAPKPGQVLPPLHYDFTRDRGSITVVSPGIWADIELDGQPTGHRAPYLFDCLPAGRHTVTLVRSGFIVEGGAQTVEVSPGKNAEVKFKLIPK